MEIIINVIKISKIKNKISRVMKIKKLFILLFLGIMFPYVSYAQIGYQVSLLNKTTGKPRANVTVDAEVTITNSDDEEIYKGTQRATSNDLGVVQLKVGNQGTFKDVNWNKIPFFIEVSVDGTVIGKSQILTVPIAEAAKYLAPGIDIEDLVGTWSYEVGENVMQIVFSKDGMGIYTDKNGGYVYSKDFSYDIEGKNIYVCSYTGLSILHYKNGALYKDDGGKYTKQ